MMEKMIALQQKRRSKKGGFTLVELVIVIAVIAILAGVMIATFSNVVCLQSISRDEVACGQRVYRMPDRRKGRPVYCC